VICIFSGHAGVPATSAPPWARRRPAGILRAKLALQKRASGTLACPGKTVASAHTPWARRRPGGIGERSSLCRKEPAGRWRAQEKAEPSAQIILLVILLIILF